MVVEGFFAFVWFGWGQAAPPSWLVVPLAVGDGLLAFGLATLLSAWRRPAVKIEVAPSLPRSVRWLTVASISTGRGKHERTVA